MPACSPCPRDSLCCPHAGNEIDRDAKTKIDVRRMSRLRVGEFITASRFRLEETAFQGLNCARGPLPGQGLCPSCHATFRPNGVKVTSVLRRCGWPRPHGNRPIRSALIRFCRMCGLRRNLSDAFGSSSLRQSHQKLTAKPEVKGVGRNVRPHRSTQRKTRDVGTSAFSSWVS